MVQVLDDLDLVEPQPKLLQLHQGLKILNLFDLIVAQLEHLELPQSAQVFDLGYLVADCLRGGVHRKSRVRVV